MYRSAILGSAALLVLVGLSIHAQDTKLPTAEDIAKVKAGYQAERKKLIDSGAAKRFLPFLMDKAEEIAKRGENALAEGRVLQASEAFRQARWQLPYQSSQVPTEHVARVLGNLRLRHDSVVNAAAFSSDGKLLATASRDRTVKVWDLANGHELRTYSGHEDAVRFVAFSPDGKMIASAGGDSYVKLWEPVSGKEIRKIDCKGVHVSSLAFSPDGRYVITGQVSKGGKDNNLLCLNEVETGKLFRSVEDFKLPVQTANFSPDGTFLAVGSGEGQVRLWDYPGMVSDPTRPAFWSQQDNFGATYDVVISPDNKTLARTGSDGVKLYNLPLPDAKFQISSPRRTIPPPPPPGPPPTPPILYTCAVFSKDSKTLFTAAKDGIIRLFDPETGAAAGTFKGHNGVINSLAFNLAGSQLASASDDFTIRLWDFDIVLQSRDFAAHEAPVWKSVFSPDAQRIASASADRSVRIWNVSSGTVIHKLEGHRSPVAAVQYSPDGKLIASAGGDKVVKLWDAAAGKPLKDLPGHQGTITALDFAPAPSPGEKDKKQRLASASVDRTVKVWDVEAGKEILAINDLGSVPAAVVFSPDGQQIAVGLVDQTIKLYDANTGKVQAAWAAHGSAVSGLAYSPDQQYLASCGVDQLVRVWPLKTVGINPITLSGHNGPLSAVAFRKDSQHVVSCGSDLVVKLWKIETTVTKDGPIYSGKETQNYRGHKDWITSVAFSKDGFYIASSGVDKSIKIWEITSREIPLLSEHTGAVQAVALSPDGKLIASGATDLLIKIWDRTTGTEIAQLSGHSAPVSSLVFTADSKQIISASLDRSLKVWDVATAKETKLKPGQQQSWTGFLAGPPLISLSPDGKKLFVWEPGNERFIKINGYDVDTGNELFTFNDAGRNVQAVSFAADGKSVATGAKDGSIRLFDLEKKGQMQPGGDWFPFEKDTSTGDIALTPNGSHLVATSVKGDLKILKVAGRETLHSLKAHAGHINACLVSPNGKYAATAGEDNMVKLWDIAAGKEVRSWNMQGTPGLRRGLVVNIAFSPDSKQLVTANANTTLFVLDLP